jgi:hypothetical protein
MKALDNKPDPCTDEAYELGCTCSIPFVHSNDIDPPEPRIDPWCPVHGHRDPDRELQEQRDADLDDGGNGDWE